jgi:hypothetical protein
LPAGSRIKPAQLCAPSAQLEAEQKLYNKRSRLAANAGAVVVTKTSATRQIAINGIRAFPVGIEASSDPEWRSANET